MRTIPNIAKGLTPRAGTKGHKLLAFLLRGTEVDPLIAFYALNLPTVHARAAELRKLGWPVRVMYRQHPELEGETYPVYLFDKHFLRWAENRASNLDPREYPHKDGRGKFKKVKGLMVMEGGG